MFPVSKRRRGKCNNCGACCKLPNVCPLLRYNGDGKAYCASYFFRPLNCRKYPRTEAEHLTANSCGFYFVDEAEWESVREAQTENPKPDFETF